MDKRRAKEIASSPVMINVTHNGMPIYIENIDENSGTANIHPINQPNNKQEVSITNLIEQ
ncbi:MAG: H-type small acid-soluble spore protein [Clostridiaceae bacterium]|nr:H-type small acid-soluble spore protein [Clostridiaceae bacterium]